MTYAIVVFTHSFSLLYNSLHANIRLISTQTLMYTFTFYRCKILRLSVDDLIYPPRDEQIKLSYYDRSWKENEMIPKGFVYFTINETILHPLLLERMNGTAV